MVRCFMTGVELPIDQTLVLNRRAAIELLYQLKGRVATLRRILEQYSPLDDFEREHFGSLPSRDLAQHGPKKHRLLCPAAAQVLAPSFPEITLFLPWPEYKARARALCSSDGGSEAAPAADEAASGSVATK